MSMFLRRGHSVIGWMLVFSVLISVTALFRASLKREIDKKARATSDYIFWTGWKTADGTENMEVPRDDDIFKRDKNSKAKIVAHNEQKQSVVERKKDFVTIDYSRDLDGKLHSDVTRYKRGINYNYENEDARRIISAGTGKNQEYLLDRFDLNHDKFKMDASEDFDTDE
ncbi:MAG: hypothetical protein GY858_06090 [Candidatus Omnitrophica bacterium]|nr:hypothetical protein [Candidatus Omnitrophota bacterium]